MCAVVGTPMQLATAAARATGRAAATAAHVRRGTGSPPHLCRLGAMDELTSALARRSFPPAASSLMRMMSTIRTTSPRSSLHWCDEGDAPVAAIGEQHVQLEEPKPLKGGDMSSVREQWI